MIALNNRETSQMKVWLVFVLGGKLGIRKGIYNMTANIKKEIYYGVANGLILIYHSATGAGGLYHFIYWNSGVERIVYYGHENDMVVDKDSTSAYFNVTINQNGSIMFIKYTTIEL